MEISGVSVPTAPAVPDVEREPPRDAVNTNAVQEAQAAEPDNEETRADAGDGGQGDRGFSNNSPLGGHIDEQV